MTTTILIPAKNKTGSTEISRMWYGVTDHHAVQIIGYRRRQADGSLSEPAVDFWLGHRRGGDVANDITPAELRALADVVEAGRARYDELKAQYPRDWGDLI